MVTAKGSIMVDNITPKRKSLPFHLRRKKEYATSDDDSVTPRILSTARYKVLTLAGAKSTVCNTS